MTASVHSTIVAAVLLALGALLVPGQARAALEVPTAAEWQQHCDAYMGAIKGEPGAGDAHADDTEVAYCLAFTLGMVQGFGFGSQLGALAMGSRVAAAHKLDARAVFEDFRKQTPADLLQVCAPREAGLRDYVTSVHNYIRQRPSVRPRPITEVFYEALQLTWPCAVSPAPPTEVPR